jgi:hypothetical protein
MWLRVLRPHTKKVRVWCGSSWGEHSLVSGVGRHGASIPLCLVWVVMGRAFPCFEVVVFSRVDRTFDVGGFSNMCPSACSLPWSQT